MADLDKPSWWKSIPGLLTAATGFVAALSGLVAGLNNLGMLRREPPGPQAVLPASPRRDTAASSSARLPAVVSTPHTAIPKSPRAALRTDTSRTDTSRADTSRAEPTRLPRGTVLDLRVPSRSCAPKEGTRRVVARTVAPIVIGGQPVVPDRATAVLRLKHTKSSAPQARLDSLLAPGLAVDVPASDARIVHGAASGSCLRAGAEISVTLGTEVVLPAR